MKSIFLAGALLFLCWNCSVTPEKIISTGTPEVAFVDSGLCADCHQEQYEEWRGSQHDLAMQPATKETVLADFNNTRFTHFGVTSSFTRKDGRFFVNTEGPDGKPADYEIQFTFGVDPLQQYLIEFPGGRLQALSVAWDTRRKRWFHLYPDERIEADDPLHWTGRYQNWNLMCAECHTTDLQKNYDVETDSYQTTYHEIDVGCQACHGPGARHLQWAGEHNSDQDYLESDYGLLVDFARSDSRYEIESCAPCHSRRSRIAPTWQHSGPLEDHFRVALLSEGLYYPDGQILDEVYVYGSFLQSRMYQQGVRCSDCHDPHSARLTLEGDLVCTRCHQLEANEDFPTLQLKDYASPEHHFHPVESEGARCVSCHMPSRNYMVVDPRRDHSFRVPRPDLSVKLATPNSCYGCHPDQTPQWAQTRILEWYGPERSSRPHFGEAFYAGRNGEPGAVEPLTTLTRDPEQPAIVRATALELLRRYGDVATDPATALTRDADALVRTAAAAALDQLEPRQRRRTLLPLLDDPALLVRLEAARVLTPLPIDSFPPGDRQKVRNAWAEFEKAQLVMADTPWAHLNLGVMYMDQERIGEAEKAFRRAIETDNRFIPARVNLATLLNRLGRNQEAEQQLRQAIERSEETGELHYNLGLLLAEMGKLEEAADALGTAADQMPQRARVRYNHGLALQQLGRRQEAEQALLTASRIDPQSPEILYALLVFYMQQGDGSRALEYLESLRAVQGPDARLDQMEAQIRRGLR